MLHVTSSCAFITFLESVELHVIVLFFAAVRVYNAIIFFQFVELKVRFGVFLAMGNHIICQSSQHLDLK